MAALLATTALCAVPGGSHAQQTSAPDTGAQPSSSPTAETPPSPADRPTSVTGQTTSRNTPGSSSQLEEVVVTANKFQQALQRAPLAVSALSANALEQRGVVDTRNLATEVPNLQIGTNGGSASVDISIRGITTNNVNAYSGNPAVAAYVNGVYVPRTEGLDEALFDVERVEVLRGPQGTLYGRNATAGAINIITAKPTQSFDARADLTYGNYNTVISHLMVNAPITDTLSVRGVFFSNRDDGYQDTKGTVKTNYFRDDQIGGRVSLLWKPSPKLSALLEADAFQDRGSPNLGIATATGLAIAVPITPTKPFTVPQIGDAFKTPVTPGDNGTENIRVRNVRANIDYFFNDNFSLSYIGGYGEVKLFTFTDGDGIPLNYEDASYKDSEWNTSHEIDFRYTNDRIKAVAGGNYTYEHDTGDLVVDFPLNTGVIPRSSSQLQFPHPNFQQTAYGVFGQATYSLTEQLRVTGGVRYSNDRASNPNSGTLFCVLNAPSTAFNGAGPTLPCKLFNANNQLTRNFADTTYKAEADYDITPHSLIYGSVSTGFKQGALNNSNALVVAPVVQPETVTNYEIGLKNRLYGGRVTFNFSAFFMDYSNLQVQQVVLSSLGSTQNITTNAAKASIYGIEIEGAWRITPKDTLTGYLTYLNANYDTFDRQTDPIVPALKTATNPLGLYNLSGNQLIRSPDFTVRLSYSHIFNLPNGGTLSPQASFYYSDSYFLREFNQSFDRQKSYTRTDLRLTYEHPGRHWTAEAFVLNLENSAVRTAEYAQGTVLDSYYAPPQRYGVRLAYKY